MGYNRKFPVSGPDAVGARQAGGVMMSVLDGAGRPRTKASIDELATDAQPDPIVEEDENGSTEPADDAPQLDHDQQAVPEQAADPEPNPEPTPEATAKAPHAKKAAAKKAPAKKG